MGLRDRVRKLEDKRRPEGCPACGGKIIVGERQEDGSVAWDGDGPCEECGSRAAGRVTCIVVEYDPPHAPREAESSVNWP